MCAYGEPIQSIHIYPDTHLGTYAANFLQDKPRSASKSASKGKTPAKSPRTLSEEESLVAPELHRGAAGRGSGLWHPLPSPPSVAPRPLAMCTLVTTHPGVYVTVVGKRAKGRPSAARAIGSCFFTSSPYFTEPTAGRTRHRRPHPLACVRHTTPRTHTCAHRRHTLLERTNPWGVQPTSGLVASSVSYFLHCLHCTLFSLSRSFANKLPPTTDSTFQLFSRDGQRRGRPSSLAVLFGIADVD